MSKILKCITSIVLCAFLLVGCTDSGVLLQNSENDFTNDLAYYDSTLDGEIPQSVYDTLDFLLENYTGGVSNEHEDYNLDDLDDEDASQYQDLLDDKLEEEQQDEGSSVPVDNVIDSEQEFIDFMVEQLKNKEKNVFCKINSTVFSDQFIEDAMFIYISGNYVIESMFYNQYMSYYRNAGEYIEFNIEIGYQFPDDELTRMRAATDKKADEIVKQLELNDAGMSDYEKVKAVNDYLCSTTVYSEGESPYLPIQHTAYGALINGDCVCEGYSKAANLIFSKCGIESYYVLGSVKTRYDHCWNIVKIDDRFYQLDITWNDADGCPNQYFLVTDDYMSLSRTWDKEKYPQVSKTAY